MPLLYPLSACFTKSANRNCAISSVGGCTTETQSNSVTEQMSEKFTLLLVLAQAIR